MISASEEEPKAKQAKLISSEDDDVDTTTDSSKSSTENGGKNKVLTMNGTKPASTEATPKSHANTTVDADSSTAATIKASGKSISQERREEWAKLLEERPITNDAESMSKWIDKILKVSDDNHQAKPLGDAIPEANAEK